MSETGIQPGSLVRHDRGVGRVISVGDTEIAGQMHAVVDIEFWRDDNSRVLQRSVTPLPEDCPEALLWDHPEELAPWTEGAPLKLVATALSLCGGTGRVADIREKLDERVPGMKWAGWWKKTPAQMRKLPEHFSIAKTGKDSEYRLLTSVDAVPGASELKSESTDVAGATPGTDWKKWLESPTHGPIPGRFPTRTIANSFATWPAATIEQALLRLITSSEEISAADGLSEQAAEGWMRAVAEASLRLRQTGGHDTRGYLAARVGEVLARLARAAGDRAPQDLLLQSGALDGDAEAWRRGFLAGMWETFEGQDSHDMYRRSAAVLGRQARGDLAREVFAAAFGPGFSERRHSELDRLLDVLPEGQRLQVFRELIATAGPDQKDGVLDYVAGSRHVDGEAHLSLRMAAVLMLSEGQGKLAARTSWELAESLADPDAYGPEVAALYQNTAARVEAIMAFNAGNVEELKETHEAQLEHERQEQDRLRQQVRERNAELAANREESRLELRQDMLLAVGEVLQSVSRGGEAGELAVNTAAGLTLALRAGGAEPLGTPGERALYDPEHHQLENHQAHGGLNDSGTVTVVAPGVIFRGGIHGDRVLLKAHVIHEAG